MSGAGLTLPPAGGGVSDQTVAFAAELIDRSGKAPVIEAALAHRTGRPRPLPVRAVLTALLCLALDDRPLFLTEATRLLFCQLSAASRRLLGVPGTATTERAFLAAYRRVRYCFGAICSVMDPSALPKNRRLTEQDLKARTRPMTPGPGRSRPRPAGSVHQRPARSQHLRPHRRRTRGVRRLHRPGRHPGPAVLPRPVQAHRAVRQRPRRRLVRPRRRPPRARGRQGQAAAQDRLGAGGHHRHHGPPARRAARAPRSGHRPGAGPARRRPRRHRRPGPGLRRRPRAQARLARLRPRLHRCAARAIPAARPRPGLPAGHGLPDRPARHPGQYRRRHPGRGHLVLPRPARAADHRHHPPARPRHHPRPVRPADHRPRLLPAQAQRRPRRRRLPAAVLPGRRQPPRADLPAAPGLAVTPRRTGQGPPATARTAQDLHPDRDHHRPRHRRPLPPGPALRQPGLARPLRHLAQHHRRPQRATPKTPPTKPSPSPPAAASAASPPSRSSPRCC